LASQLAFHVLGQNLVNLYGRGMFEVVVDDDMSEFVGKDAYIDILNGKINGVGFCGVKSNKSHLAIELFPIDTPDFLFGGEQDDIEFYSRGKHFQDFLYLGDGETEFVLDFFRHRDFVLAPKTERECSELHTLVELAEVFVLLESDASRVGQNFLSPNFSAGGQDDQAADKRCDDDFGHFASGRNW